MIKCTNCNEYNQEKHYCPKFCDVIRDTTREMQEYYRGEHEKLELIKQIVNKPRIFADEYFKVAREIKEILEQE